MFIHRQTTGSLYFWAAHLAGPKWGPLASWCCAWLETVGSISGIGTQVFFFVFFSSLFTSLSVSFYLLLLGNGEQAYSGAQALQMIILLATGTHKNGGYFVPRGVFVAAYMSLAIIWAILNSFSLQVIAFLDIISFWWQVYIANAYIRPFKLKSSSLALVLVLDTICR